MQNEELRRTQEALESSRTQYFRFFDLAPVGYLTLGEKGLIMEANLAIAALLGVEKKNLVRQPLTRFIFPADQDIYYFHFKQLLATEVPQVCELRLTNKSGEQFWVRIGATLEGDADEAILYHVVLSDITESKQMEATLQETNKNLERKVKDHTCEIDRAKESVVAQNEELRQSQEALRRSARIQDVLREIAEAAIMTPSLDELYEKVHRAVGRVLSAKNFYISLLDDTGSHFVIPYCVDETHTVPQRRPVGKGLTDYVMSQRKAVYVTPAELARLRQSGDVLVSTVNYHKWAGAPLIDSNGKAFGIIALFLIAEDKLPLQPEDLEILTIIAAQVSLAIERKRAEEALREE